MALVITIAGIIIIKDNDAKSSNSSHSQYYPYKFNNGVLKSGNSTLYINGYDTSDLCHWDKYVGMTMEFCPLSNQYKIINDSAIYSGNCARETLNMTSFAIHVLYVFTEKNITEVFSINNKVGTGLPLAMHFFAGLDIITNVTISQGNPDSYSNTSIVQNTYGFTETYNFNGADIYNLAFAGTNASVNWYNMRGINSDTSLTFSPYSGTCLNLQFSGITIPPYSGLTLGSIVVSY